MKEKKFEEINLYLGIIILTTKCVCNKMFLCLNTFSTNHVVRNILSPSSAATTNDSNQHRRKSAVELTASSKANKAKSSFVEGSKV